MQDQENDGDRSFVSQNEIGDSLDGTENIPRLEDWQSVENSALKLLEMLDKSSQAYFLIQEGRAEFLNRACVEMTGYSNVEWSSLPNLFEKIIHPQDLATVQKYYENDIQRNKPHHNYVCRIICKDGSIKWVDIQSSGMIWKGKPSFLAVATDITQYIRLQNALQAKSESLNKKVKGIECLYQISRLTQTSGLSQDEILEKLTHIMLSAMQYPEMACAKVKVGAGEFKANYSGTPVCVMSEEIFVDGHPVGVVEIGYIEHLSENDDGPFLREEKLLIKSIADHVGEMIARKRANAELRIRDKAIRASMSGIGFANPDGRLSFVNEAFIKMWGYESRSEVIGRHVSEFWNDPDAVRAGEAELLKKGSFLGERTALRKDGSTFEALLSTNLVINDSGKVLCLMGSFLDVTEQKRTRRLLEESEQLFRIGSMCASDDIYEWDLSTDKTAHYGRIYQSFGYEQGEFPQSGEQWANLIHPDDRLRVESSVKNSLNNEGLHFEEEYRILRKSGEFSDVSDRALVLVDEKGSPCKWIGAMADITKRKMTENHLRQSEERFRQVADSADEWIWEVDENGLYTYSSSAVERILGYSSEEIVGEKFFYDFFVPEERDALKELSFNQFGQQAMFSGFINRNVRKNGEIAVLDSSGVALADQNGNLKGYRGVDKDVTEKLRAEQERIRLFTAIEQSAASVVITDSGGSIEYVNPAFERITGYKSTEVIGKNPRFLKSGKLDKVFYKRLWDTIAKGDVWTGRLVNKAKNGAIIYEEGSISPIKDSKGNIANYVRVTQDVTEQVDLQNRLIQAQKMEAIGTLAGGIAHDFNNIIFAITGYTELVMQDLPAESRARANLERVMEAAQRSSEMVKQILTFSRRNEPELSALDLTPLVKEGLKFLRAAIPSTIEIHHKIQSGLGKILGDPTQIHQILMNLCVNASQSMPDLKGTITVELSQVDLEADFILLHPPLAPGKHLNLRVSDTGVGIPAEIIDKVFDPYFTTKESDKGTGLGLSVVHGIAQRHQAAITLKSELGKGTTFDLYFPVIEKNVGNLNVNSRTVTLPRGKELILIVDDDTALLEMLERQLKRLGYAVTTSVDPVEALKLFLEDPPDFKLVITDLTMPRMTGLELATELRSMRPDLPIILCSGYSQELSETEKELAGIWSVLTKPVVGSDLAFAVRNALDSKL